MKTHIASLLPVVALLLLGTWIGPACSPEVVVPVDPEPEPNLPLEGEVDVPADRVVHGSESVDLGAEEEFECPSDWLPAPGEPPSVLFALDDEGDPARLTLLFHDDEICALDARSTAEALVALLADGYALRPDSGASFRDGLPEDEMAALVAEFEARDNILADLDDQTVRVLLAAAVQELEAQASEERDENELISVEFTWDPLVSGVSEQVSGSVTYVGWQLEFVGVTFGYGVFEPDAALRHEDTNRALPGLLFPITSGSEPSNDFSVPLSRFGSDPTGQLPVYVNRPGLFDLPRPDGLAAVSQNGSLYMATLSAALQRAVEFLLKNTVSELKLDELLGVDGEGCLVAFAEELLNELESQLEDLVGDWDTTMDYADMGWQGGFELLVMVLDEIATEVVWGAIVTPDGEVGWLTECLSEQAGLPGWAEAVEALVLMGDVKGALQAVFDSFWSGLEFVGSETAYASAMAFGPVYASGQLDLCQLGDCSSGCYIEEGIFHCGAPPDPIVIDDVQPTDAVLGQQQIFSVYGQNLPGTLSLWIQDCADMENLTRGSELQNFRCTPSYSAGPKDGVVEPTPGGGTLHSFTVLVVEAVSVDQVTPTIASLGTPTTFTVTGSGMPDTLSLWIEQCTGMVNLTRGWSQQTFQCTPSSSVGTMAGEVAEILGGPAIHTFTVSVTSNSPPTPPSISAPSTGDVSTPVLVPVIVGTDPDGDTVKVQCISSGSNYSSAAYDSGLGSGGRTVMPAFTWSSDGTKTISCTSFDQYGASSSTVNDTIYISATTNAPPTAPGISAPATGAVSTTVSVPVVVGTDPDGDNVKVQCTSAGSNYSSTAYDSGLGTGGRTVTPGFAWSSDGTKIISCTSFDQYGAGSSTISDTIYISAANSPPTPPSINAPSSGAVSTSISVLVTVGTDPDGDSVKVQCTSAGSNYASTVYDSGLGAGGRAVTPGFTWSSTGTKTISCTSFDQNGASSSSSSDTIDISSTNSSPNAPSINAPSSGAASVPVAVPVTVGTDPDGDTVKVQCTSAGSNYSSSAYDSGLGAGGRTVTPNFTWSSAGSQTIYCTSFDQNAASSSIASDSIYISAANSPPTTPSINAPSSGAVSTSISVPVVVGTDADGDNVKVQCTSAGSNYSSSVYDSGLGAGGRTVTPGFSWSSAGSKTIYCTAFDQNGASSSTASDTITISSGNSPPTTPSINAPSSGAVSTSISVPIVVGTDADGDNVKVQCTSAGSNYSSSAYDSGLGAGGRTVTPGFSWSSTGSKTIYCTAFDQNGASSSTASDTITISSGNSPPTTPSINAPSSGAVSTSISVLIVVGTDADGDNVKVQCTSAGSNYSSSAYDSGLGAGGRTVTPGFSWSSAGSKTIYCTSFDQNGASSSTASDTITIVGGNSPPTMPNINAPSSGAVSTSISVPVVVGTDADGDNVKVQCTSAGSNYSSSAYDSGLGAGGRTVTPGFSWSSAGSKTIYCTSFDQNGASSSTASDTITISSGNSPPTTPSINAPSSGAVSTSISVPVVVGTDADGDNVKVQCTSAGSNYSSSAYDSGLGAGGRTVTPGFSWSSAGSKTIYCTSFDQNGASSSTASDSISISSSGPSVSSVSPLSVTLGSPTVFTVNGANMPSTLTLWIADCASMAHLTTGSSQQTFRCTPSYSTGSKSGLVKDAPGGNTLHTFTLNVTN
jgi:hypothetical protein